MVTVPLPSASASVNSRRRRASVTSAWVSLPSLFVSADEKFGVEELDELAEPPAEDVEGLVLDELEPETDGEDDDDGELDESVELLLPEALPETEGLDDDEDGVLEPADHCPDVAEDRDGFEDNDGCPDPDNDKDGVLDKEDKCPNEPGPADNNGCPKKYEHIVVTQEKIELKQKVHFATDKATIYPDSFAMLTEIAEVLKSRPEVRIRIEGHTDSRGGMKHNMTLSQARADSVKQFLVGQGVDPARMESRGFGPTQAIADNRTAAGREQNRRVEFIITAQ